MPRAVPDCRLGRGQDEPRVPDRGLTRAWRRCKTGAVSVRRRTDAAPAALDGGVPHTPDRHRGSRAPAVSGDAGGLGAGRGVACGGGAGARGRGRLGEEEAVGPEVAEVRPAALARHLHAREEPHVPH